MTIELKKDRGFSILEVLVSVAVFSMILVLMVSFAFWMNKSNYKSRSDAEVSENGKRVMGEIVYEIMGAKSIYTPTTTSNQLSLETIRYLPADETDTFIDFFICGSNICLKKESQNPITLLPDTVKETSIAFSQILNGNTPSVQINLTVSSNDSNNSSISLVSTAALRKY